jgi:Fe-S cluster assembly scaffold protein SufB
MLGSGFVHFDDIGGVCEENAVIDLIQMEMGAHKVWNGCHINLLGKEASFQDNTGYLCRYDQQYDMNYVAEQRGRKTQSEMIFRGVLMDQAQKTFRGTIDFRNGSCGSTGDEQEDTLLLSPDVINRTIPLILCQEEDVDGRHGATIGQLGEDLLFYMQTRGISAEEAKKIMVRARLESIGRLIPEDYLRGTVEDYIRKIL